MLIDTHCHFNHPQFARDANLAIDRAYAQGVLAMIVVGYDRASSRRAMELADSDPRLYASVGIHPHDASEWDRATETEMRAWANHSRVVAIGEIGLDYYRNLAPRDVQMSAFRSQLLLARDVGLPVIIHCRDAYDDTLDLLEEVGARSNHGVMHCWAGTANEAQRTVELGLHLGFGGTTTYKNADNVRESLKGIPEHAILLETDAPYLSPIPHRGKRNEPAFLREVAQQVAVIRDLSVNDVEALTTTNAHNCFPKLQAL